MDIASGVILGIVQGLTEFFPISSSGHLILVREILGLQTDLGLSFDAVLQLATSLAILVYFRREFLRLFNTFLSLVRRITPERDDLIALYAIIVGTIPAVIFGLLFESSIETSFRSPLLVAVALIVGSALFFAAEKYAKRIGEGKSRELTIKSGLWIGFFQALALIPGMSRSGVTISGGLFFGLTREKAARFSFLLAFPIIFGSGMKKFLELGSNGALSDLGPSLFAGAVSAFVVGIFAIHYLLKYLKTHTLGIFIIYRLALAAMILAFVFI